MDGFLLFLHLFGLSIWLGSILSIAIILLIMKRDIKSIQVAALIKKTVNIFNRITHPSAFIILASGIWMLIRIGMDKHDQFPFWLKFMEQAGSMIILIFIVSLSNMGRRVKRHLTASDHQMAQKSIQRFVGMALILGAAVIVVIFVVSAKL